MAEMNDTRSQAILRWQRMARVLGLNGHHRPDRHHFASTCQACGCLIAEAEWFYRINYASRNYYLHENWQGCKAALDAIKE
jgi:hypothetical protein